MKRIFVIIGIGFIFLGIWQYRVDKKLAEIDKKLEFVQEWTGYLHEIVMNIVEKP